MSVSIVLTDEQMAKIRDRVDERPVKLSDEEVESIASKLNKIVDLPFMGEEKEQKVFRKLVNIIDDFLYTLLPDEIYEMVKVAHDGLSLDEAEMIKQRVTKIINRAVNIPILSEDMEAKLLGFVVGIIIDALPKEKDIKKSAEEAYAKI